MKFQSTNWSLCGCSDTGYDLRDFQTETLRFNVDRYIPNVQIRRLSWMGLKKRQCSLSEFQDASKRIKIEEYHIVFWTNIFVAYFPTFAITCCILCKTTFILINGQLRNLTTLHI